MNNKKQKTLLIMKYELDRFSKVHVFLADLAQIWKRGGQNGYILEENNKFSFILSKSAQMYENQTQTHSFLMNSEC